MDASNETSSPLPLHFRILGACMVVLIVTINLVFHNLPNLLWLCNFSTLLAGISLMLNRPYFALVGAAWIILGTLSWLSNVLYAGTMNEAISFFTHFTFSAVALYLFARIPLPKNLWIGCFAWFLLAQVICRFFSEPMDNINIAHTIWPGWEPFFGSFVWFWFGMVFLCSAVLFSLNWGLYRLAKWRANSHANKFSD